MKWTILAASAVLAFSSLAAAAPDRRSVSERSSDVPTPQQLRKRAARAAEAIAPNAAAALDPQDVGDADSFGRAVTYLGFAVSRTVVITDDCAGVDPALTLCVIRNPAPLTTIFQDGGNASIKLPAKASKSLLCFNLTPFIQVDWANQTPLPQIASFASAATISIDNPVLDDPTLIDPFTGLPFGGTLDIGGFSTWRNSHTMQPGEVETERSNQTRACIGGIVSKAGLMLDYGLTEAQANQFFRKPMTVRFGTSGSVALANQAFYFYGIRLFGD